MMDAGRAIARVRHLVAAQLVVTLGACSFEETPEYVFVRTDSVVVDVAVRSESRATVGEWLALSATRSASGEWQRVRFDSIAEGTPWIGYEPPAYEAEVAANLRWFAEPMDGVEFDAAVPRPVPVLQRAVRFSKPGTYRLWATSHAPLDARSNTLQVEVTAQ